MAFLERKKHMQKGSRNYEGFDTFHHMNFFAHVYVKNNIPE